MSETIILTGATSRLLLRANTTKQRRLEILAYSGGLLRGASGVGLPAAIDLSQLRLPARVPLNADHSPDLAGLIGSGTPASDGRRLTISATLADNSAAAQVVTLLESDIQLQASVEVSIESRTEVEPGATVELNGQTLTAPADGLLVIAGALRAVAVVAAGADKDTSVRLTASRTHSQKGNHMSERAELRTTRVAELQASARQFHLDYAESQSLIDATLDEAIRDESMSVNEFETELLRACTRSQRIDNRPRFGGASSRSPESARETLAAAFLLHAGAEPVALKAFGPAVLEAARGLGVRHALDLAAASCRLNPTMHGVPSDRGDMLRAAMGPSTFSLPAALGLAGEKLMVESYGVAEASWRSWTGRKSVTSFRAHTSIRPNFIDGSFEKVERGGVLKHGAAGEETYELRAETFGRLLSIDRQSLIDDDLGVFGELFAEMGRQAVRKIGDVLYSVVLDNAGSFFGTGNANFDSGSDSALDIDGLSSAVKLLRKQKDKSGRPIGLTPRVLLVPPELETTALQIVNSTQVSRDSSEDQLPTGNAFAGRLAVEVEPRLSDSEFHSSASETAWYLLAGPTTPAAVLAFLNGRDAPTVEQLQPGPDQLGLVLRGFLDFGASLADFRAGVLMAGA